MIDLAPSQSRLQRPPDFSGERLYRFSQVALRHGLPVALVAAVFLFVPEMRGLLGQAFAELLAAPWRHLQTGLFIFCLLLGYAWFLDRRLDVAAVGWILYLLAVSIWEEWVFRLGIPYYGQAQGLDLRTMVVLSNVAFGVLHYFTLRWKWHWCVIACFGGMALSRHFHAHFDLVQVIAIHWIATFINTPRLPGRPSLRKKR